MAEHTYEVIADHGDGEKRSILERRSDGAIVLTTNAETRQPVTPLQFAGPGWDSLDTGKWLDELEMQFDSREAAEIFVQAAGRELPESCNGLLAYAEKRIAELNLGENGPLGTEFVVAYDDAGEGKVRIDDGHGKEICSSKEEIDAALQAWVDWINED